MRSTPSEAMFQRFCQRHGIPCERVTPGAHPSPDFVIELVKVRIACEVKQIDPNDEDLAELEQLRSRGSVARYVPNRMRGRLKQISRQLKASAQAGTPTLLVVYDNTPFKQYSDHTQVIEAMFGPETVTVSAPLHHRGQTVVSKPYFGGNRGLGPSHNTSISAIAILSDGPASEAQTLRLYYNPYAAVPLDPTFFDGLPVTHALPPGTTEVQL